MKKKYSIMIYNIGNGWYDKEYTKNNKLFKNEKRVIRNNIFGQVDLINDIKPDILMIQESSKYFIGNYFINPYKIYKSYLSNYNFFYFNNSRFLSFISNGLNTLIKFDKFISSNYVMPFKLNGLKSKIFYNNKKILLCKGMINNRKIAFINIHLMPYREYEDIRIRQINFILDIANREYSNGYEVIIGGDFNMNLSNIIVSKKWNKVIPNNGTSRDLNYKYSKDCTLRTYDSFIVSKGIKVNKIKSLNNYLFSDHSPVIMEFEFI